MTSVGLSCLSLPGPSPGPGRASKTSPWPPPQAPEKVCLHQMASLSLPMTRILELWLSLVPRQPETLWKLILFVCLPPIGTRCDAEPPGDVVRTAALRLSRISNINERTRPKSGAHFARRNFVLSVALNTQRHKNTMPPSSRCLP